MKALLVYESMFGNTQAVAEAVAEGIAVRMPVQVTEVGATSSQVGMDIDLLVVGAPTHAFSMSRPATRENASHQARRGSVVSSRSGLREWLAGAVLPTGIPAAAFDTKMMRPRLPGSAAHAAEKRLRGKGSRPVGPVEHFYVTDTQGPLAEGELVRARAWGAAIGAAAREHIDEHLGR
jgi:hypothetical protein